MWHIDTPANTVQLTDVQFEELATLLSKVGYGLNAEECMEMFEENYPFLTFDDNADEHMDYLQYEEVREWLQSIHAEGVVIFSSDGNSAWGWWSYEFDGKGGMNFQNGGHKDIPAEFEKYFE